VYDRQIIWRKPDQLKRNIIRMNVIQFISAFGLGAIVTALIQAWLSNKAEISKRNFQEKKECYIGYLAALHESQIEQTEESALNVGHWANRIELAGSRAVVSACVQVRETNPTPSGIHPGRDKALSDLKEAMRRDLGVSK
jgi:hypothetical protein